ncbi:exo-beta-1,3-glucanase-like protein [Cryomyces antarcticus]
MRATQVLLPLWACLSGTIAQHVHYQIPEVEEHVHSMLAEFAQYTNYHAPTNTKGFARPTHVPKPAGCAPYWMENIKHQGIAAFNANPAGYQVFRNVKDFGAVGDGVADDTAAIQAAITTGGRCAPGICGSSTTTPAVVYFPSGTYLISKSIIDYYYTQIIGNPNCLPTIRAAANFTGGLGMLDGDQYGANGLGFGATNVFWRQVRNFIFDMTLVNATSAITGIHWPTAQATSLQNIVFEMSSDNGTQHQAVFIESGSGGFMNDLVFYGGNNAMVLGNQQFTMRNLTFHNAVTAINQLWDWGWTYKNVNINNCSVGLNMASGGRTAQSVGSVTFIDSSISNTAIGIITAHDATSQPPTAGSLILENVKLNNVPTAIQGPGATVALEGTTGASTIAAWGEGHSYTPNGPTNFEGPIAPNPRPGILLSGDKYYERSKPQYENYDVNDIISVRSAGAAGDGKTDDTDILNKLLARAANSRKLLFFDHGDYKVTGTLYVPPGSKIVGESYSVILAAGPYFSDMANPKPVVQVGKTGESGRIEWSDMIVSTQGATAGAILVEWNLAAYGTPSGVWDVHSRVGGFDGSNLQLAQCPTTPTVAIPPAPVNANCIAAFMTWHITKSAAGLYMENVWLWVADHDVEDSNLTQITVYAGRGLYDESSAGTVWLVGTAVEHHVLYEYQFANTKNVFAGQIQTETAYYQPNPNATIPFPAIASLNDPVFPAATGTTPSADGWGLRVINSQNILVEHPPCSNQGNGEVCQNRILSIEGSASNVNVYNLNTVGTTYQITRNGVDVAKYSDNLDGFVDTIALYRSG